MKEVIANMGIDFQSLTDPLECINVVYLSAEQVADLRWTLTRALGSFYLRNTELSNDFFKFINFGCL